jgi:hypothetical protein
MNHITEVKEKGYTILEGVFSDEYVKGLLSCVKDHYEYYKDKSHSDVPRLNTDQPNIYNLQNKGILYTKCLLDIQELEDVLIHFLNDKWYKQIPQDLPNYQIRSFGARSSRGALPFHIDSFIPYVGDEVLGMQVAIALEDQTEENGCTLVSPGSHQSGKYAPDIERKDAVALTPKAGDVVIWDSRLWHGTTENTTDNTRWAIIATFSRWWLKQHFDITGQLPAYIKRELSPKEQSILGFNSIPCKDEFTQIDMKRGYDA